MAEIALDLADESATMGFAADVARVCAGGAVIYLRGNLGTGKTTFARGFLRALGVASHVKSPTFTVVEPYEVAGGNAAHFDLYRINDPEELSAIGIREYFAPGAWVLVEWPERGQGVLPPPDLELEFKYKDERRRVVARARTERGAELLQRIARGQ
jgi:tRNA threonylcarbamoyladenosine biosynthesis protein TsaE